jgi:hypothetical protein
MDRLQLFVWDGGTAIATWTSCGGGGGGFWTVIRTILGWIPEISPPCAMEEGAEGGFLAVNPRRAEKGAVEGPRDGRHGVTVIMAKRQKIRTKMNAKLRCDVPCAADRSDLRLRRAAVDGREEEQFAEDRASSEASSAATPHVAKSTGAVPSPKQ